MTGPAAAQSIARNGRFIEPDRCDLACPVLFAKRFRFAADPKSNLYPPPSRLSWPPFIGQDIAEAMGWRTTFVGALFIAGATSLPELAVTISALRLGAVDMAIGNLLGSNLFDVLILALDDIAYTKGSLFASASPTHAVTAFAAVIMSGLFIVALLYRPETRFRGTIGWVGLLLVIVYLLSSWAVYLHGH